MLLIQLSPQIFHLYSRAYSSGGLAEGHPIPLPSLHGGKGYSFPGCVPLSDTVNSKSVVAVKPSDSGVVIGIKMMNSLAHGWQSASLLNHIFILV